MKDKMNQNKIGNPRDEAVTAAIVTDPDLSEESWVAHDFAIYAKEKPIKAHGFRAGKDYEVRPCKNVRGHVLRLPVTGWALWFPSLADAVSFARKLAGIHRADCCIYDSDGSVLSRSNILESSAASAR
jgi:hypothetical protein